MVDLADSGFQFYMPVRVVQGAGRFESFEGVGPLPFARPMIVTGSSSARALGYLDQVQRHFEASSVFEGVEENPGTGTCERGAEAARRAQADGIVALGGGSVLDAAKAIALLAVNGGRCSDYFTASNGVKPALPMLAIPTTSGTGSEVTPYSVLVDSATGEKATISHPSLFPAIALLDPVLTYTMPAAVSLATGLDVLSQGMEGVVSRKATPISDALALETCRLVAEFLPRVVRDPADASARAAMQYAAMLSGIVVAHTGTTLVHGMGYRWTTECGVAHGIANASLLKAVFAYTASIDSSRVASVSGALGATVGSPDKSICDCLNRLYADIGFNPAISVRVAQKPDLDEWAQSIAGNPYRLKNQRGAPGPSEILAFYERSWSGD